MPVPLDYRGQEPPKSRTRQDWVSLVSAFGLGLGMIACGKALVAQHMAYDGERAMVFACLIGAVTCTIVDVVAIHRRRRMNRRTAPLFVLSVTTFAFVIATGFAIYKWR